MNRTEIYKVVIEGQLEEYKNDADFISIESFVNEMQWVNDINSTCLKYIKNLLMK